MVTVSEAIWPLTTVRLCNSSCTATQTSSARDRHQHRRPRTLNVSSALFPSRARVAVPKRAQWVSFDVMAAGCRTAQVNAHHTLLFFVFFLWGMSIGRNCDVGGLTSPSYTTAARPCAERRTTRRGLTLYPSQRHTANTKK